MVVCVHSQHAFRMHCRAPRGNGGREVCISFLSKVFDLPCLTMVVLPSFGSDTNDEADIAGG